jgi:hypothetical protein
MLLKDKRQPHSLPDYLERLIMRIENYEPSPWLEGLQSYF